MRLEVSCLLKISQTVNKGTVKRLLSTTLPLCLDVALVDLDALPLEKGEHPLARGGAPRTLASGRF